MHALATGAAGFLLAVLWFDLMFDVQAARHRRVPIPEPVLSSIASYYRRVTTEARPMNRLVVVAMAASLGALSAELAGHRGARAALWCCLPLIVAPISLAVARTVPAAVRLGSRRDPPERQAVLARTILRDHVFCLACVAGFLGLQLSVR